MRDIAWQTQDAVIGLAIDAETSQEEILWCNEAFTHRIGLTLAQVKGKPLSSILTASATDSLRDALLLPTSTGVSNEIEAKCLNAECSSFWSSVQIIHGPTTSAGKKLCVAIIRDITEVKKREEEVARVLQQLEDMAGRREALWSRLMLSIDAIDAPLGVWDKDNILVLCNKAFGPRLMGRALDQEPNITFDEFIQAAAGCGHFVDAIDNEAQWIESATKAFMERNIDAVTHFTDGRIFLAKSVFAPNGDMVVHNIDVTEVIAQQDTLREKNKELEKARAEALLSANRDDLTLVGSRRTVDEELARMGQERAARGGELAVLVIDLDRFKHINDTLGHSAGDQVLKTVAERLSQLVQGKDHLARLGGDEFVILIYEPCEKCVETTAYELGKEIVHLIGQPIRYQDSELRVGASVGISMTSLSNRENLLIHADVALYKSKSLGRNQVSAFSSADLDEMRNTQAMGDALLMALDRKEFFPLYQPQIDAHTGQIVGLEALARWRHPERGVLAPIAFLQFADDLNVLGDIDQQIFEHAITECSAAFAGRRSPDLSFNASQEHLLATDLDHLLKRSRDYPGHVAIELVETIFLDEYRDSFGFQLDRLRDAGIGIELDDFGSGRASIIALERLAPDRFKIDRSLTKHVCTSERSAKIVRSLIEIGNALNIPATAEGVETKEQAQLLTELGCDRLQGYYFGAPMPLSEILSQFDLHESLVRKIAAQGA